MVTYSYSFEVISDVHPVNFMFREREENMKRLQDRQVGRGRLDEMDKQNKGTIQSLTLKT